MGTARGFQTIHIGTHYGRSTRVYQREPRDVAAQQIRSRLNARTLGLNTYASRSGTENARSCRSASGDVHVPGADRCLR